MGISRDDWLSAFKAASEAPIEDSDALTVLELADLFGLGRCATDRRIKLMVAAGKAERTHKFVRRGDVGVVRVPAYRLLNEVAHGDAPG